MGKQPSPADEIRQLKDTIRQGHELLQALTAAIREARKLEPDLTARFEQHANREIHDLSNQLQQQANQRSAELNERIAIARDHVIHALQVRGLAYDPDSGQVTIAFNGSRFDDQVPMPYPQDTTREKKL